MDVDCQITLLLQLFRQILQLMLVFGTCLLKRQRTLFHFVVLVGVEILQVVFQTLAAILCTLEFRKIIFKLFVSARR